MNAPLKALANDLDLECSAQVYGLLQGTHGWNLEILGRDPGSEGPFDAVVLAIPPEQATSLLAPHDFDLAVYAAETRFEAVWSAMAVFDGRLPIDAGRLVGCEVLSQAIRETSKPGRSGPEAWTLQATSDWSRRHLESSAVEVAMHLTEALARRFDTPLPHALVVHAHRWRYARPAQARSAPVWRPAAGLGLCGDWVVGDGVEAAWLSGVRLADLIGGREGPPSWPTQPDNLGLRGERGRLRHVM